LTATAEPTPVNHAAPQRILIVLLGSIGDVVRALPLLGRLRKAYPRAHIAWAVEPKSKPVLERHPWIDELIVHERGRSPWAFAAFLRKVRAARFDLVLDLQRILKSGAVSLLSGASLRFGFAPANAKELNHLFSNRRIAPQPNMRLKLLQYQAFGDALGIAPAPVEFGLKLPADELAKAKRLITDVPRPMLGVILGSSWPSRVYFAQAMAAAIRELAVSRDGHPALSPLLIDGPQEVQFAAEVMRCLDGVKAFNLAGRTTLRDLIGILSECAVAFGPDSGPMHIAAAVGCPVVSLWGATAPERSAPWGFAEFAIKGEIPCHPCYLRICPIGRECMRRITPEMIVTQIRRALAGPGASARVSRATL
jgi:ADP-heptose:LPS heptosyltransferase